MFLIFLCLFDILIIWCYNLIVALLWQAVILCGGIDDKNKSIGKIKLQT